MWAESVTLARSALWTGRIETVQRDFEHDRPSVMYAELLQLASAHEMTLAR